jgi:hypothetical protein
VRSRSKWFSPVAYYVTKRQRRQWLEMSDHDLLTVLFTLPGKRMRLRFGATPPAPRRLGQAALSPSDQKARQ